MKSLIRALCAALCCLSAQWANAQAIATMTLDWKSLTITANGSPITPVWQNEQDILDHQPSQYYGGFVPGANEFHLNPGWATPYSLSGTNPGGPATVEAAPDYIKATGMTQGDSNQNFTVGRSGEFIAPVSGIYTISIDYSGLVEINTINTELINTIGAIADPFLEYTKNNATNNNQDGNFTFNNGPTFSLINNFGSQPFSGTVSLTKTFGGNDIVFAQGDLIRIDATANLQLRSNLSTPIATPLPAAFPLLLSGLGLLSVIGRRRQMT